MGVNGSATTKRMRPYTVLAVSITKALARFCMWMALPVALFLCWRHLIGGPFRRQEFEAIVAYVRGMGLNAGEVHELRIDDFARPETIRLSAGQWRAHRMWAEVSESGHLKLTIETSNAGHWGGYGFAYSDASLAPVRVNKTTLVIDVPGINWVAPDARIDDHWWRVMQD
jgi:hypothetical protein